MTEYTSDVNVIGDSCGSGGFVPSKTIGWTAEIHNLQAITCRMVRSDHEIGQRNPVSIRRCNKITALRVAGLSGGVHGWPDAQIDRGDLCL
jgi:hypothetical protein